MNPDTARGLTQDLSRLSKREFITSLMNMDKEFDIQIEDAVKQELQSSDQIIQHV